MRGMIKKWGNSAAVRIPAAVLEAAKVQLEQPVDIHEEDGRIVIEKVRQVPRYNLDNLVATISDHNRHEQIDFGERRGREVW